MSGGGKGGSQVMGYKYFLDVHTAACHGPIDSLNAIIIGEREAWTGNVTSSQTIYINKPQLFGGDKREGGVVGNVDIMFGEPTQAVNDALSQAIGLSGAPNSTITTYTMVATPVGGNINYVVTKDTYNPITGESSSLVLISTLNEAAANAVFVRNSTTTSTTNMTTSVVTTVTTVKNAPIPAFRDLITFFFRSFQWSSINPYFKSPWFDVTRILKGWRGGTPWYSAKAVITASDGVKDMNPAHILYQCITDNKWGMGYNFTDIDDASFSAAADALYAEGFGLSMPWRQQSTVEDFMKTVIDHINASFRLDLTTGLFKLTLVRDDYDVDDLVELNVDNVIELSSFQRAAWGDTANQVILVYTGRDEQERTVTVEDLAGIDIMGGVVPLTRQYPGIRDPEIARRVAMRDLTTAAAPLAKVTLKCNRVLWDKAEGDVFKLVWEPEGIAGVVFRIVKINKGEIRNGIIEVEAVEDVFGLPDSAYVGTQPGGWIDPVQAPHAVYAQRAIEAPYWDVVKTLTTADLDALTPMYGFGQMFTTYGIGVSGNFGINAAAINTTSAYEEVNTGHYMPYALVHNVLTRYETTSTLQLVSGRDLDLVEVGGYAYIEDECVEVTAIDTTLGTATVLRAVLDTTPADHVADVAIWFNTGNSNDPTERTQGETTYYRATPSTPIGTLAVASATAVSLTFIGRADRPYPPGNVRINGVYYATSIIGPLTSMQWSHRNRLSQTVDFIGQTVGDITPEVGTTYTVTVRNANTLAILHQTTGITGNSWSWTNEGSEGAIGMNKDQLFQVESSRGGVASWQHHSLPISRIGLGYDLGTHLGGELGPDESTLGYGMGYGMYYGGN